MASPPDRPFVTMWNDEDDVEEVTFEGFLARAAGQAEFMRENGLSRGERAVLIMPQGIELMSAFIGAMLLGAIPAILAYPNFKMEPAKYRSGLGGVSRNLKPRLLVLDKDFPNDLLEHVHQTGHSRVVRGPGQVVSDPTALPGPGPDRRAIAFIQHSAGTTGLQKGVALTHAAVLGHLGHLARALQVNHDDKIYSWLPLYHDMGLIACFMLPVACHVPVVMQSPTNWVMQPAMMLELITRYRCTVAWAPNFTLQFLARRVQEEDLGNFDLSSMRALINCSEPIRARSMDEFLAVFERCGFRPEALRSSYAMAETVFAVTQSPLAAARPARVSADPASLRDQHAIVPVEDDAEEAVTFVSSGPCLPGSEVRVVSGNGELEDGRVGELLVRSESLFDGYFNRPDLTSKVLVEGWYRSGDLGFRLEGEIFVVGRKKDVIIQGGKNIYPQDVEEIVMADPHVHDGRAVAFGVLNADLGTEDIIVVAEVESEEYLEEKGRLERQLRGAIVGELGVTARAVFLKPPMWVVKSTAGKPARSATRDKLFAEHPELTREQSLME
jgi:acyl-CoA synthetase (AMP-forming)/AMP-acid ligase II